MKIVIDMQPCQSGSRFRGIGRYSLLLTKEIARQAGNHDIYLFLNDYVPETLISIAKEFDSLIPSKNLVVWSGPRPVRQNEQENSWLVGAAELVREQFLVNLKPDLVHVNSHFEGYIDDVVTSIHRHPQSSPTSVVAYDLIPHVFKDIFLTESSIKTWYNNKFEQYRKADLFLSISNSTTKDLIEYLGVDESAIHTIYAGVDDIFSVLDTNSMALDDLKQRYNITKPFITSVSAHDLHKNQAKLVQAYAKLPNEVRSKYQLVLIGETGVEERNEIAAKLGIPENSVIVTGYISDHDLVALYNATELFVLPSLYEGFGLPALEAMHCGAPVIGSNTSSIPEVIGLDQALFDPNSVESIAEKLHQALTDEGFLNELRKNSEKQSKEFTWKSSAKQSIESFERLIEKKNEGDSTQTALQIKRPSLAYLSPLPPIKNKISDYSVSLLPELAGYYDITLVVDQKGLKKTNLAKTFPIMTVKRFKSRADEFDRILYQIGNSTHNDHMFSLLERYPGTVIMHDFFLGSVYDRMDHEKSRLIDFNSQLYDTHGYKALIDEKEQGREIAVMNYPMNKRIIDRAAGLIFHSRYFQNLANQWHGLMPDETCLVPMQKPHNPQIVAQQIFESIECFAESHPLAKRKALIRKIAAIPGRPAPRDWELAEVATSIAEMTGYNKQKFLFFDISILETADANTGIQRTLKSTINEFLNMENFGYRIEPIHFDVQKERYYYANSFMNNYLNLDNPTLNEEPIESTEGDIFLLLDINLNIHERNLEYLLLRSRRGARIFFLIYDLLPIFHPSYFSDDIPPRFIRWIKRVSEIADGAICISKTVADEYFEWLNNPDTIVNRTTPLKIGYSHIGADIMASTPTSGLIENYDAVMAAIEKRPTLLMVGTVEIRKGHKQVVSAFEQLWAMGEDIGLVIVGKLGWKAEEIGALIETNASDHLFWIDNASDEMLQALYEKASGLIMASNGEGFGLPLIEAAQHGLPIISRDLPVFREVAGEHAYYFSGNSPEDLAGSLKEWLELCDKGQAPSSKNIPWLTWKESTQQFWSIINNDHWYRTWFGDNFAYKRTQN